VIEDFDSVAESEVVRARLPYLTLKLDPRRMTADEQNKARQLLENALERLAVQPVNASVRLGTDT
jgi:hypothetical protein